MMGLGTVYICKGHVCSENGWREFELSSSSLLWCIHLLIREGAVLYLCIYSVNSLTASLGATYHCCANIQMRKVRWDKAGWPVPGHIAGEVSGCSTHVTGQRWRKTWWWGSLWTLVLIVWFFMDIFKMERLECVPEYTGQPLWRPMGLHPATSEVHMSMIIRLA